MPGDFDNKLNTSDMHQRALQNFEEGSIIVLHDSLLPKYRGFAPLVNQLINGENEIGVTALFASEEYDRGPIIDQRSSPVTYPIKIGEAIDKVSVLYADLVERIFDKVGSSITLPEKIQDESQATYSLWRDGQDYRVDWALDDESILRHINAVGFPYLGALTEMDGIPIRIISAEIQPDVVVEIRHPGKVIFMRGDRPVVVCGSGLIRVTEAFYDENGATIFPLKKFRIRFS